MPMPLPAAEARTCQAVALRNKVHVAAFARPDHSRAAKTSVARAVPAAHGYEPTVSSRGSSRPVNSSGAVATFNHEGPDKALERSVIRLSLNDTRRSLRRPSMVFRMIQIVFGLRPPNRVADPRLEALRAYAVTYRTRGCRSYAADVAKAESEGVSPEALELARQMVDAHTAGLAHRHGRGPILRSFFLVGAAVWLFKTFLTALDDALPAMILTLLIAALVLPFAMREQTRRSDR